MNKKENHWYILDITAQALKRSFRPRVWQIVVWLALITLLLMAVETGALDQVFKRADSPAFVSVSTLLIAGLALGIGLAFRQWRLSRTRASYWKALQYPHPDALLEVVAQAVGRARALPDADAFHAQSKAIAYALYGRGDNAMQTLAEINWGTRAPLIQAAGLSAEGIVQLICFGDVSSALALTTKAQNLASLSSALPGAAQSSRYHGTCVAVSEALLGRESSESVRTLEAAAADPRFPPLQLLASFGLAAALDHSGSVERARQVRAFVHGTAPHSTSLRQMPSDFSASAEERGRRPVLVSGALPSAVAAGERQQERIAKRRLFRLGTVTVGLWVLLIVAFLAIQAHLNP